MDYPDKKMIILKSAEEVFKKFGYSKASMDDIAREAGIAKATTYYYFESKEDIFLGIMTYYQKEIEGKLNEELKNTKGFENKFRLIIELPMSYMKTCSTLLYEFLKIHTNTFQDKMACHRVKSREKLKERLFKIMEEGKKEGTLRDDLSLEELIDILIRWFFLFGDNITFDFSSEAISIFERDYKVFTDIILNGITKRS